MELVTESQIAGEFHGWNDGNVYELVNGQKWKQVRYKYRYSYKYRPKAMVFRDGERYFLEVDGMDDIIEVRRIY